MTTINQNVPKTITFNIKLVVTRKGDLFDKDLEKTLHAAAAEIISHAMTSVQQNGPESVIAASDIPDQLLLGVTLQTSDKTLPDTSSEQSRLKLVENIDVESFIPKGGDVCLEPPTKH